MGTLDPLKEEAHVSKEKQQEGGAEGKDSMQEAMDVLSQLEKEDAWRMELKRKNSKWTVEVGENTQPESGKREKSIAKVQKIVSRLKRFTESDRTSLLGDLQKLDVTMHLSEVADALAESPMKQKDVCALVEVCSLLVEHYGLEFSTALECSLARVFRSTDVTHAVSAAKRRSLLRFLGELTLVVVIPQATLFVSLITDMCSLGLSTAFTCGHGVTDSSVGGGNEPKRCVGSSVHQAQQQQVVFHNIGTVEFLARKFNTAILGEAGVRQKYLEGLLQRPFTRQCTLASSVMTALRNQMIGYYHGTCRSAVTGTYTALLEQISANQSRRINKGQVDAESETRYTNLLATYTRLGSFLESLSNALGLEPFTFSESEETLSPSQLGGSSGLRLLLPSEAQKGPSSGGLSLSNGLTRTQDNAYDVWEDDTEKDFYTNLLNLADAVPACLLGLKDAGNPPATLCGTHHTAGEEEEVSYGGVHEKGSSSVLKSGVGEGSKVATTSVLGGCSGKRTCADDDVALTPFSSSSCTAGKLTGETSTSGFTGSGGGENHHGTLSLWEAKQEHKLLVLDQFVCNLCRSTLASEVDNLAIKFFYEQLSVGKVLRKRLISLLMGTHRNDLHVLPSLARFLATIGPFCKDVLQAVTEGVCKKFKELLVLKDPLKFASLVKTARLLGELCKFRLIPSGVILDGVNELLLDFSQNNIEVACHLIQTCGRFLLAEPGVKMRLKNLVEKLMKMKNNRNLPIHLELMVEDSYFQLFPSERHNKLPKQLSPCRQFIHWLVYEKLHLPETIGDKEGDHGTTQKKSNSHLTTVVTCLRRLNWDDPQIPYWIKKAILESTSHISFVSVGNIAHLLCRLVPGYPEFVISCMDDLFEAVQLNLESNDKGTPQRIRMVKLIGELFIFRLIDTSVIFQTLYQHIQFCGPTSYGCHTLEAIQRLALLTDNTHLLSPPLSSGVTHDVCDVHPPASQSTPHDATVFHTSYPGSTSVQPLVDPLAPEDPRDDYFRLKLVCVLLDVCGQYFNKGPSRDKMDRFLYCLQRYMWFKRPLPVLISHEILDTLERLRPQHNWEMGLGEIDHRLRDMLHREAALAENKGDRPLAEPECCDEASCDTTSGHQKSVLEGGEPSEELTEGQDVEREEDEVLSNHDTTTTSEDQATEDLGETEDSPEKRSVDSSGYDVGLEDEDDEENLPRAPGGKTEEELQAMMFDLELSRIIMQSLQEAKPSFGVVGQRGRIDALLEDVRLPPLPKLEQSTDLPQNQFRVRLVTRKSNHPNKVSVKLVDIPKQSRLCQAVFTRETKDAQEHERLKRFVMDSVARHQRQEQFDRQNAVKNQMFYTSSHPHHKNTKTSYPLSRRRVSGHVVHSKNSFL